MKCLAAIVLAMFIPVVAQAAGADAAKTWLGLVDANDYAQSWKSASTLLQSHVTEAQWQAAAKAARAPLGPVVASKLASADSTTTLPGAPDGHYIVIKFDTRFANKAAALETIARAMDAGSWKTSGYYVR